MKYIKLKCNTYDCKCQFLIAMDDWHKEEYSGEIHEYYSCPICEGMVRPDDDCVIDLP